jgi:hypothetical protein
MAQYSTSDFEKILCKKGFEKDKTHHKMFWLYYKGVNDPHLKDGGLRSKSLVD